METHPLFTTTSVLDLPRTQFMFLLSAYPLRLVLTFICFDLFNLSNTSYRVRLVLVAEMAIITGRAKLSTLTYCCCVRQYCI